MHSGCTVTVTQAARRVRVGVAQLLGPDLERRVDGAASPSRPGPGSKMRPVVQSPSRPGTSTQPARRAPGRPVGDRVPVAVPDPRELVVAGHQRAVVGEPGRLDELERARRRATSTARETPPARRPSAPGPPRRERRQDRRRCAVGLQLREVLVDTSRGRRPRGRRRRSPR